MLDITPPTSELARLAADGLLRKLRPLDSATGPHVERDGKPLVNFGSNDYLGLAGHPRVIEAFGEGIRRYGAGSAASRLVCGSLPPHQALEDRIAGCKGTEAALTFSSGYATALGVIPVIVGRNDTILLDKLAHACLVDAARLSGATLRVFPHNDCAKLSRMLASIRAKSAGGRILVVTESVFSMDGDLCPLAEIVALTEQYDALLLLDEAHAIGVLGPQGMGLAEELGLQHRIAFQMGTLSKAIGLCGGYVAASRGWIDLFINRARSFIFSTAPPPAIADAAITSLEIIRSTEGEILRQRLASHVDHFQRPGARSPILPFIIGGNEAAIEAAAALEALGFLVPPIRYPTVPRGTARLRASLSAEHTPGEIEALSAALSRLST
jgi:8-amino-7-oxononanoate synthase